LCMALRTWCFRAEFNLQLQPFQESLRHVTINDTKLPSGNVASSFLQRCQVTSNVFGVHDHEYHWRQHIWL
jgi:hypothetical protein